MNILPTSDLVADPSQTWEAYRPAWLYAGLLAGNLVDENGKGLPVDVHHLGMMHLPSGRLVACDPVVGADLQGPFEQILRPGIHQAFHGVVWVGEDHSRNAAFVLVSGSESIASWELGVSGAGDVDYFVDAGVGCYLSAEAQPGLVELARTSTWQSDEEAPLTGLMDAEEPVFLDVPGGTILALTSGWGDGNYPTWFGRSAQGEVVVAMTDFIVVEDPLMQDQEEWCHHLSYEARSDARSRLLQDTPQPALPPSIRQTPWLYHNIASDYVLRALGAWSVSNDPGCTC